MVVARWRVPRSRDTRRAIRLPTREGQAKGKLRPATSKEQRPHCRRAPRLTARLAVEVSGSPSRRSSAKDTNERDEKNEWWSGTLVTSEGTGNRWPNGPPGPARARARSGPALCGPTARRAMPPWAPCPTRGTCTTLCHLFRAVPCSQARRPAMAASARGYNGGVWWREPTQSQGGGNRRPALRRRPTWRQVEGDSGRSDGAEVVWRRGRKEATRRTLRPPAASP
jgi:hypothetical protein